MPLTTNAPDAEAKIYVLVEVVQSINPRQVDITGNLMKFRQESTNGTVVSLRDEVNFAIAADPSVTLDKRITHVNGTAASNPNAATVKQGDVVSYSVDLRNTGTAALRNDVPVTKLQVWDALPKGYNCGEWAYSSTGSTTGVCVNPGQPGYPAAGELAADGTGRSLIKWTVNGPLAAGATASVTYTLTVPADAAVSSVFQNHASLVGFEAPTTGPVDAKYLPENSLRVPQAGEVANAPEADDKAVLNVPAASVTKSVTTPVVTPNNSISQVVGGELIDYTYSVTVPARTSVYNGILIDTLPAALSITAATVSAAEKNGVSMPLVVGASHTDAEFGLSANGTLTFPKSYRNASAVDEVFTVKLTKVLAGTVSGSKLSLTAGNKTNSANFTSDSKLTDGTPIVLPPATAVVTAIVPRPTIVKTAASEMVGADGLAEFTIVVGNTTGSPLAYDRILTDCLPSGLTFESAVAGFAAPTVTTAGCASGAGTLLTWNIADASTDSAKSTFKYTAKLSHDAGAASSYTNSAQVVGSSLADGKRDEATEILVSAATSATVKVASATVAKQVTPQRATIGQTVAYTVTVTIPANANFYNSRIVDDFPAGIDVSGFAVDRKSVV